MDMRKYTGSAFRKVDDVREGPIFVTIADIEDGRYDKPNLIFDDGSRLSVNATNAKTLVRAFGPQSEGWIGKKVKLVLGKVKYQGESQESVIVEPLKSDDDDIPF